MVLSRFFPSFAARSPMEGCGEGKNRQMHPERALFIIAAYPNGNVNELIHFSLSVHGYIGNDHWSAVISAVSFWVPTLLPDLRFVVFFACWYVA